MKTLADLDPNDCRYPSGDGAHITFCSAPQHWYHFKGQPRKSSYCRTHHFVCTTVSFGAGTTVLFDHQARSA